jgi:UDP-N-acetylmuramoyl-tripeptide--D-alanyl-D-alanine ligase
MVGCTPEEMRKGLSTFTPPPGRSEVHQWRGSKVYADTYNANPASVEAALEMLGMKQDVHSPIWACLGDMLELGSLEEALHRGLAGPLKKAKVAHVFLFGERMKKLEDELKKQNFPGEVRHFSDIEALAKELIARTKPGDRILLKGSRGMRMERAWESLAKNA